MKIKKMMAENAYSFGKLNFEFNHKGTTLIIGRNEDQNTANGAGKSSILKILYLGLWGKELNAEPVDLVAYRGAAAGYLIDIEFEDKGHNFRIVRYRDRKDKDPKTGVDFYIDDELFNGETSTDTQKNIERKLKISAKLFKSAIMTTQKDNSHFLTASDTDKKEIFSELLDLTAYSAAFDYVKKEMSSLEKKIDDAETKLEHFSERIKERADELGSYQTKEDNFENEKTINVQGFEKRKKSIQDEITSLRNLNADAGQLTIKENDFLIKVEKLKTEKDELSKSLEGESLVNEQYTKAQQEYTEIKGKHDRFVEQRNEADNSLQKLVKRKDNPTVLEIKTSELKKAVAAVGKIIENLGENKTAVVVLTKAASSVADEFNTNTEEQIKELTAKKEVFAEKVLELVTKIKVSIEHGKKVKATLEELKTKRADYKRVDASLTYTLDDIKKIQTNKAKYTNIEPEVNAKEIMIESLHGQMAEEKARTNPYKETIEAILTKLSELTFVRDQNKKVISTLEEELKYLNFWKAAFSPLGIRSFIFDEVIDLLNQKVQSNLNDLFEGAISVVFESESKNSKGTVSNKISTRFYLTGKETTFGLLSGGEQQRAVLAVNLALTEIAESYSGTAMNIKFLDEPFEGIDSNGQIQCFRLFSRLAQNKDGFYVISHDQSFQELCPNAIYIVKKNGESKIVTRAEFNPKTTSISNEDLFGSASDDEE